MQTSFKNNKKEKSETMGYLAQRKKHLRTDFILKSLLVLLAFFSAAAFAGNAFGQFLNQWRFQFYLLSLLVMFYALFNRFFLYSFLALLLLLLNFFVVSSSVPVLFSGGEGKGKTAFGMIWMPCRTACMIFSTMQKSESRCARAKPVRSPRTATLSARRNWSRCRIMSHSGKFPI